MNNSQSNFKENAVRLIDRGLSVIPCQPGAKDPILGATKRTRSKDVVEQWAQKWPTANVAICSDDNITLLETDDETRFREKIRKLTGREIPATLACGSGRPNRRCWIFARTSECGDTCSKVDGLFEHRNRNQYVVGPGSIHPSGLVYRWLEDASIIAMPDWLMVAILALHKQAAKLAKISHHQKCDAAGKLFQAYRLHRRPEDMYQIKGLEIIDGEQHYTLLSCAGFLHDGKRSEDEIALVLKTLRDLYCVGREIGDYEVENIAAHVSHREPCVLGGFAMLKGGR